jgi:receptor protein-tyrosine kinase
VSKLFDIMSGTAGEIPDLVRPLFGVQSERPAPAGKESKEGPADPAPACAQVEPGQAAAPLHAKVRTVKLRVAAPSPLLPFDSSQWRASEQYRILRTKIVQHARQPSILMVSSPTSGDGKSVSSINSAAALSMKDDAPVLLLDADFRKSVVHSLLGLPQAPGLAEVLNRSCSIEAAVVRTQEFPNLFIMCAGATPKNPVELLDSAVWRTLITQARGLFRYVVLDSPPVGAVADYELLQAVSDGVILVVRPDHTKRRLFEGALKMVPNTKLLGVLLNDVPDWLPGQSAGAAYYYYSNEEAYYARGGTGCSGKGSGKPEAF